MAEDPNPVEFLPPHLPRTELEQLTDALNAGHITPELFALAKEKLLRDAPVAPASEPLAPETPPSEYPAGELPPLASLLTELPPAAAPTKPAPPTQPLATPTAAPEPAASPPPASSAWAFLPEPTQSRPAPADRPPVVPVASPPTGYNELLTNPVRRRAPDPESPAVSPPAVSPPAEATSQPAWLKAVLVVIILGVLVLIYREVAGSHPDEQLTSPRHPRTEVSAAAPPTAAKARPHRRRTASNPAAKGTKATNTASSPKPAPVGPAAAGTPPEPMPQPLAAAPEAADSESATRVRTVMAAYYADMLAPPFTAARHFGPHVERLYIQQNLTPADIDANFARSFFPDNKQALFWIEPGTLRVSPPVADGSRVATFVEGARIYHPSRRGYQRLRAQVRVRFNADYQIVYLRQERLLESTSE